MSIERPLIEPCPEAAGLRGLVLGERRRVD
jgi:hypothetical protein